MDARVERRLLATATQRDQACRREDASGAGRGNREGVAEDPVADTRACGEATDVVKLPVNATIDAAHASFVHGVGERAVVASAPIASDREVEAVAADKVTENGGGCAAEGAVAAGVAGVVGRGEERDPCCIACGVGVAVGVAQLDTGFGPPEELRVLGFPRRDASVSDGETQKSEEARALFDAEVLSRRDLLRDFVPLARGSNGVATSAPEEGGIGLILRASGAVEAAEFFHFVVGGGVLIAGERRHGGRGELR